MSEVLKPPVAEKRPFEIVIHNDKRNDPYYWLREKENAEVISLLEAENAYTEQQTAHLADLRQTLYEEMVSRIKETDDSVPVKKDDFFYYSRTEQGKQYPIYCRKQGGLEAEEEVLIDLNQIAEDGEFKYLVMSIYEVSPNHDLLAFGLDTTGAETYTVRVKNLKTGDLLDDVLEKVSGQAEWGTNDTLFYVTEEEGTKRSDKLWRHKLGTAQSDNPLVYHESDGLYSVGLGRTKDEKYVVTGSYGIETYEVWVLSAETPTADFQVLHPREAGLRYQIEHRNGIFYIVTNADGAKNSKLMMVSAENPTRENWIDAEPYEAGIKLHNIELFDNFLVRHERENGQTRLRITDFRTDETHTIDFEEPVYYVAPGANVDFNSGTLRFSYSSMVTPASIFDYDMTNRTRELKKQQPVLGGFDASQYTSERIFATAEDGAQIPMSLVYHKGARDNGLATVHLYGYGSYGFTIDPMFSSNRVSLLDRGVVYAIAHVRGSQMMGREWYENGKFLHKKNTFTDFIACAKHLIANGYTEPAKMTMEGRSAGGLLMGAVLNIAPELFTAAVAGVPFVDVVTTMLDETIPLTIGEFDEWGNPKDETYYWYMLSYSPYDQIEEKEYPNILAVAGLNDPRVQYWEPTKWVQKLRDTKTDDNDVILKMFMGAGHFSSSGRYDYLKDIAFDYAFILDQLGLT